MPITYGLGGGLLSGIFTNQLKHFWALAMNSTNYDFLFDDQCRRLLTNTQAGKYYTLCIRENF